MSDMPLLAPPPARVLRSFDDLVLIGDIHGDAARYHRLVAGIEQASPDACSIQLGDLSLAPAEMERVNPERHWFLRGNHDNPAHCRQTPHFLGDYGLIRVGDRDIFFAGGAQPAPDDPRTGEDWDAEMSARELERMVACYASAAGRIDLVLSHDWAPGPWRPPEEWSATRQAFSNIKKLYFPSLWVHGHGRKPASAEFRALDGSCFYYQVGMGVAVRLSEILARSPRPPMP